MRTAIALVALALAATAADGRPLRLIPPPEYDHPYAGGKLDVVEARDQDHVRMLCPTAMFGVTLGALACSLHYPASCTIVIAPEAIKASGVPLEIIMRHEMGHCNGWPADHKGALPYEEWAAELAPGGISKKIRTVPVPGGTSTVPMTNRPYPEAQERAGRMPAWQCGIAIQVPCD